MIRPGGMPGVMFGRSATTRMNNNQIEAQKRSMPHNQAAQASLRKQSSKQKAKQPGAVGKPNISGETRLPQQQPTNVPTGGPSGIPPMEQEFDPSVFVEQRINDIVGQIKMEEFANSPQTKDAMTVIKLKNFFNQRNPNYRADTRSLFDQIGTRTGANNAR